MHKLKIVVLGTRGFPDIPGGVEKHCEELYPRLVKLGCDVMIFVRSPYVAKQKRIKEWNGVKFKYIWCPRQKSLEAFLHTFFGIVASRLLSPDILHIHAVGPALLVLFAKLLGLKVVMTHHGPDYERQKWGGFAKRVLRAGEYIGVRFSNKVIVISKVIKKNVEKHFKRDDLIYIPNGVNSREKIMAGETLKKYGLADKKYVFTACRFVPEKGLHDLVEAYKNIENPFFKLVIAGDADHETEYSRKLKESAKNAGIILTGFISGRPLLELYSNAGLFVLPSYYEGLPIALLEAMSYNLPILVSDIPANKEVSLPEYRYFKAGNVGELLDKMVKLIKSGINDEERKVQKKILSDNYNWDNIAEKTISVYREV